jgi:hypothetical protein
VQRIGVVRRLPQRFAVMPGSGGEIARLVRPGPPAEPQPPSWHKTRSPGGSEASLPTHHPSSSRVQFHSQTRRGQKACAVACAPAIPLCAVKHDGHVRDTLHHCPNAPDQRVNGEAGLLALRPCAAGPRIERERQAGNRPGHDNWK